MPIAIRGPAWLLYFSATDFWIPIAHKMAPRAAFQAALKIVADARRKRGAFQNAVLTALSSNDAARLEIEAGQAADRHRGDLQPDPEARPERFTHARHSGGVGELDQDPNLVELAIPEDLDLELLDRGEAPHDPLDGRREDVDAT